MERPLMKRELYNYDFYPMVFPKGEPTEITVKPLGVHAAFKGEYTLKVMRVDVGTPGYVASSWNHTDYTLTPCGDGCLRFTYTAEAETELIVRLFKEDKRILQFNLYALDDDLACRIPLRGDLHMHTCRSDGGEDPAIVCANYRKLGYDFIFVTDHQRYYPSLEAIAKYKDADIPLNIMPGEEVHLPGTAVHIVNAGGLFSVNAIINTEGALEKYCSDENAKTPGCLTMKEYSGQVGALERVRCETNGALDKRRFDETVEAPAQITLEEYEAQIAAIEATCTDVPEGVDRHWYAVCCWAFDRIREAGGLGVFAHPYWLADMWHVPEPFTRYMFEKQPFDAFEVLGGELYYEQNGFQTSIYYDEYRNGRVLPIVGSTDSHGSTAHNRNNFDVCSTIVFAHENERADIIQSIKDKYSVAVDTISREYRLVGEHRLQKYACFLMENFYPIHDRQTTLDGEVMRQYYVGDSTAEEISALAVKSRAFMKKYFRTR